MLIQTTLDAVLTGKAVPYSRKGTFSGIAKAPRQETLEVSELGLSGDEQGDLRVHGGPEKAIHHYPFEYYEDWRREIGEHPLLATPGAFGENFSTTGWTEQTVCLGDRFQVGSVVLQVTQGRMPCWKLNDRFAVKDMSLRVQQSGRTGWYYRVLQAGSLNTGDRIELVDRSHPQWSIRRIAAVLFTHQVDADQLRECLELPLTASWRRTLEKRLDKLQTEDWAPRLQGPVA